MYQYSVEFVTEDEIVYVASDSEIFRYEHGVTSESKKPNSVEIDRHELPRILPLGKDKLIVSGTDEYPEIIVFSGDLKKEKIISQSPYYLKKISERNFFEQKDNKSDLIYIDNREDMYGIQSFPLVVTNIGYDIIITATRNDETKLSSDQNKYPNLTIWKYNANLQQHEIFREQTFGDRNIPFDTIGNNVLVTGYSFSKVFWKFGKFGFKSFWGLTDVQNIYSLPSTKKTREYAVEKLDRFLKVSVDLLDVIAGYL